MKHSQPSPLAGQTLQIKAAGIGHEPVEYRVEDWWDRVNGQTWGESNGNPAAMAYALRAGMHGLPWDDEVLYGKVGPYGYLVHVNEVIPS